mmetsp:Transcript_6753/g.14380  ORF Transcript_6753/g.14380 Transcript_6753/m.14380 type:complete len:124 (-) Transcript_6753:1226-1597(-)
MFLRRGGGFHHERKKVLLLPLSCTGFPTTCSSTQRKATSMTRKALFFPATATGNVNSQHGGGSSSDSNGIRGVKNVLKRLKLFRISNNNRNHGNHNNCQARRRLLSHPGRQHHHFEQQRFQSR